MVFVFMLMLIFSIKSSEKEASCASITPDDFIMLKKWVFTHAANNIEVLVSPLSIWGLAQVWLEEWI